MDATQLDALTVGKLVIAFVGIIFSGGTISLFQKFGLPIIQGFLSKRIAVIDSPAEEKAAKQPAERGASNREVAVAIREALALKSSIHELKSGQEALKSGQEATTKELKNLSCQVGDMASTVKEIGKAQAATEKDVSYIKGRLHGP